MKKLFLCAVFVLICALTLCSCAKKTDNLDEFEQLLISTSDNVEESEAFAKLLYVIIPKDCSPDVSARATALAEAIEKKTGIETILKYFVMIFSFKILFLYRVLNITIHSHLNYTTK